MLLTCAEWAIESDVALAIAEATDALEKSSDFSSVEALVPYLSDLPHSVGFSTLAALCGRVMERIVPDGENETLGEMSSILAGRVAQLFGYEEGDEVTEDLKFVSYMIVSDFDPIEDPAEDLEAIGGRRLTACLLMMLTGLSAMMGANEDVSWGDPIRDEIDENS
jgi:hypothetical protein